VHTDPAELGVPRPDGTLRVLRWGRGPRHAVALHGITASAMAWEAVAEDLPTEWSLFAVDLRGRGHSAHLPGPYGWDRHLEDVLATVAHLELEQPVLAGHRTQPADERDRRVGEFLELLRSAVAAR
jgi:pimeloyl-ACP methyl ester carboxylesterase